MCKFFFLLCLTGIILGDLPANANVAMKEWTFLTFLNGNNNLDSYGAYNINEMEKIPAFLRRNVQLKDTPHSSESTASRYTLSESETEEGEEKKYELKKNNPFLHDNVD